MTVRETLLHHVKGGELVQILDGGYNVAMCFIDYEDLFIHGIPKEILDKEVKRNINGILRHKTMNNELEDTHIRILDIGSTSM